MIVSVALTKGDLEKQGKSFKGNYTSTFEPVTYTFNLHVYH